MSDDDLVGDPMDYNPQRSEGEISSKNVPTPDTDHQDGMHVFDSSDLSIDWEDSEMWFDCPYCGRRLCSKWFYLSDTSCDGCGATVNIKIEVQKP